jgi:hypothetical protein
LGKKLNQQQKNDPTAKKMLAICLDSQSDGGGMVEPLREGPKRRIDKKTAKNKKKVTVSNSLGYNHSPVHMPRSGRGLGEERQG